MSFLQKFGFWIAIVAACVAAVLAQFLVVKPMSVNNTKLVEDLDRRRKKLQSFVSAGKRGELKNEKWIKDAEKQAQEWEKERGRCEKFFQKQQTTISKELTSPNGRVIKTPSRWVTEFKLRCSQIEKGLRDKDIKFDEMAFTFQRQKDDYDRRYPRSNEMPRVTRTLHVLQEFIRILSSPGIKLTEIETLKIDDEAKGDASDLPDVTQEGVFEAYPYVIVVKMEFERILYLMGELLGSKLLDLSVERVTVLRPEKADADKSNVVTIRVIGRYMDYDVKEDDGEGA